jgi:hypothetical protein
MHSYHLDIQDIKSHEEIDGLINEIKTVEHHFENIDFLKDLPDDISYIQPEPLIDPKPVVNEPIDFIEQPAEPMPDIVPPEIEERIPQKNFTPIHKVQTVFNDKLIYPLFKTPEVGHTTFTLQIQDNSLQGFYKQPDHIKTIDDVKQDITSRIPTIKEKLSNTPSMVKQKIQQIKEKGLKNELKNLPNKIITPIKNINVDKIKTLPNKIKTLISSDKE